MEDEVQFPPLDPAPGGASGAAELSRLQNVPVELAVEIGRTQMTIGQTLQLRPGSVVSLNRLAGEPVDLLVNGKPIARGEVVVIDEEFGLRVTDIVGGPADVERVVTDVEPGNELLDGAGALDPMTISGDFASAEQA
jgi:flagellar motor switch protein FliN